MTDKNQAGYPGGFSRAAEKAGGMTMHEAGVFDQLIPRAFQTGAEVVVLPKGMMEDGAGAAAVLRF